MHCLAYANDVDLVTRNHRILTEAYEQLESGTKEVRLKVNVDKVKYMLTSKDQHTVNSLKCGDKDFERVKDFRYPGFTITENNETSVEVRIGIAARNRSSFATLPLLKSNLLSTKTKLKIYRTIVKPVVTYGVQ